MKIIYYSSHPNLHLELASGPGTHMREIIKEFEEAGHQVIPVIMGQPPQKHNGNATNKVEPTGLKSKLKRIIPSVIWQTIKDLNLRRFDRYAAKTLEESVEKYQPDLIYERAYYLMTSGVRIAHDKGIPHVLELNAPYPEEKALMEGKSMLHALAKKAERTQLELTQMVVVVSSALKSYTEKCLPGTSSKTLVVPNAIDPKRFEVTTANWLSKRSKFYIPHTAVVFGFVGSIFPYHGVSELIDAFIQIANENAHLLIVGDGAILHELQERARKSNCANRIHFTGKVAPKEVPTFIAAMDICVMARSNWYGSPVKIFEYGALEKAIIAPHNIPVTDAMVHGQDGLLVKNQKELVAAMSQLQSDASLRNALGSHFCKRVYAEFTWKQVAQKTLNALKEQV